jgi:hypothetical protein
MSGKNLELSLVMRLRDLASSAFTRSQRDIQSGIAKTEKATDSLTRTVGNLGKVRSAAEVLGLRTEQNIQREIQRTEAAYNRLARSGSMSMREQARAAEVARNKVRELNNEMGKFTLAQKTARGLQTGATVAGGAAAAGYVLSKPIGQTMDYGMRLAQMSNTAFTERDTIGRIAGKRELNTAIVNATRVGGGTRESSAETLDTLIASGAMSGKDAMGMLPTLTKAATASGADSSQLAQIGIRGMQTFGIKSGEMGKVIDMAITAGQAGGFELKDMARWLPEQMAAAKMSGISGTAGMAKLLAANQASKITAGSNDAAGNNLKNLLLKINSGDTAKDAQKLGINLSGTIAAARGKGIDGLDAFVGIVDHIVGKDKNYQALQTKLKTATGAERKSVLESQTDILQGSAIGQIVQDREALMALVGIMSNRDYMADVQKKTLAGDGATDKNFAVMSSEAGFKTQQAANEKIFATQTAFENLTPIIGSAADGFSGFAQELPNLTASLVAATTALTALAAAAGAAGLVSLMGGGKGGILETILTKTKGAPAALGRGALAAGAALGTGTVAASTAMVVGAGAVGYGLGSGLNALGGYAAKGTRMEDFATDVIGKMAAQIMASLGSKNAEEALVINLHLDGQQITQVVNARNNSTARRN